MDLDGPVESDFVEPESREELVIAPERHLPHLVELSPVVAQPVRMIHSRSVLILESDLSIRKLLRRLLDRRGHFTNEVAHAHDLPGELRSRRVDLLIADAALLGPNGLAAAFALTQLHPDLKILTLTSESVDIGQVSPRCLALTKPFSLESFLESVDRLLEPAGMPDRE
jgi:DNA-binding NtrC family response regulator